MICALVIDHIDPLAPFFAELRRVRRTDGYVVVSVVHPAMMLKGVQARFRDPATGREVRPESVAHELSDYVMAALRAGATICELSEHRVDEALAASVPRAARYLGWPLLFMMKFR